MKVLKSGHALTFWAAPAVLPWNGILGSVIQADLLTTTGP